MINSQLFNSLHDKFLKRFPGSQTTLEGEIIKVDNVPSLDTIEINQIIREAATSLGYNNHDIGWKREEQAILIALSK